MNLLEDNVSLGKSQFKNFSLLSFCDIVRSYAERLFEALHYADIELAEWIFQYSPTTLLFSMVNFRLILS